MERIESLDDPRVAAYRNLRERTLRGESIFVTEGRLLALRLLASDYQAESLLVTEAHAAELARPVGGRVPLYVAADTLVRQIVGFPFHRGVLAVGRRPAPLGLGDLLGSCERTGTSDSPTGLRLIVCPEITQPENLGLVFRTAAAFGVDGLVLGKRSCDPLSRRSLRLSMGAVLQVPFLKSADLSADLRALKDRWGVALVATVLDQQVERLADFHWPLRVALLFGNEFEGLRPEWLSLCDRRVTIPMHPGTDSLNLGVAAGIVVYEMCRQG
jgi:tRNA G18 (ribose-2'-O)-methylase SpoU